MRRLAATTLTTAAGAALLAGCGSGSSSSSDTSNAAASPASTTSASSSSSSSSTTGPPGKLLDAGFGQDGDYAWVTSLVKNTTGDVGHFVTVQFNVLDKAGNIIASDSQVEQFSRADQTLVLGTQVDLAGKKKAAKVEATVATDSNTDDSVEPYPKIPTGPVKVSKSEYGGWQASFEVHNPTDKDLPDARVGIVCYAKDGSINGGASAFPSLVPPSGKALVEQDVMVSGKPDKCEAHVGPGI